MAGMIRVLGARPATLQQMKASNQHWRKHAFGEHLRQIEFTTSRTITCRDDMIAKV